MNKNNEKPMGIDLRLMPLMTPGFWIAHGHIEIEQRSSLWPAIENLPAREIPTPLKCYLATGKGGKTCYGKIENDPFGNRLKWTKAADLFSLKKHKAIQDNWLNRAAWSYLDQMPSSYPIVLYWH